MVEKPLNTSGKEHDIWSLGQVKEWLQAAQ
ncbi:hypothetical protein PDIG_45830 [Penicillium digitatum PHI26]|uniref:Uncharacterized protein n=2 Tax=Penicillium digitatum TaxID=36651 RepID=K9GBJ5_PEND2|nr:hypothetical protein PDIP_17760 [Penicillium digitatum Pd1]EKV12258.1 hypothetical protein PDIG_45830 [Penicillium digitatum PHI26]EKV20295.1 hypothetical protein PDIP_17760 [Penicillium digitatum Pd1]